MSDMSDKRLEDICKLNGLDLNAYQVRYVIRRSFPRLSWYKKFYYKFIAQYHKPQAFHLEKSLRVLQVFLGTQDLDKIIDWAYEEN